VGAFSYDNGPPVLNTNVDVLPCSEKDDVEGDDVKRGSETGANLNMAAYFHKLGTPQVTSLHYVYLKSCSLSLPTVISQSSSKVYHSYFVFLKLNVNHVNPISSFSFKTWPNLSARNRRIRTSTWLHTFTSSAPPRSSATFSNLS